METTLTELESEREQRWAEDERRVEELAVLSSHLTAATARWVELAWELHESGSSSDPAGFLAYRCGITRREAGEFLRVAEALQERLTTDVRRCLGEAPAYAHSSRVSAVG